MADAAPLPSAVPPVLSVILIVRDPADRPDAVLAALAAQTGRHPVEVIVVDGRPDPGPAPVGDIRRVRAPGRNMPHLKALGVAQARAAALAFLEPKAVPDAGWLAAVLRTLDETPAAAFGGAVGFAGAATAADRAAFVFEYAAFSAAQLAAGLTRDLPGNNMVLPRAGLLAHCGDILAAEGLNKPFCQQRLMAAGVPLRLIPDMRVEMTTRHRLAGLLTSRMRYARCFGGTRMTLALPRQRWLYRLGAPVVPLLVLGKQLAGLRRAEAGPRVAGTLPALMLLCLAWAAGEISGYWRGPGTACQKLY